MSTTKDHPKSSLQTQHNQLVEAFEDALDKAGESQAQPATEEGLDFKVWLENALSSVISWGVDCRVNTGSLEDIAGSPLEWEVRSILIELQESLDRITQAIESQVGNQGKHNQLSSSINFSQPSLSVTRATTERDIIGTVLELIALLQSTAQPIRMVLASKSQKGPYSQLKQKVDELFARHSSGLGADVSEKLESPTVSLQEQSVVSQSVQKRDAEVPTLPSPNLTDLKVESGLDFYSESIGVDSREKSGEATERDMKFPEMGRRGSLKTPLSHQGDLILATPEMISALSHHYHFEQLPQHHIRLVRLLSGSNDSTLRAILETTSLIGTDRTSDQMIAYEALSYCWENEIESHLPCFLDLFTSFKPFQLMTNQPRPFAISLTLDSALRRLRYADRDRILWINAVCVNIRDEAERFVYVQNVARIFNSAQSVCIWLGEKREGSSKAMYLIYRVSQDLDLTWLQDSANFPQIRDLIDLIRRPWFSRRWAVSEIASARSAQIYCGPVELSWERFKCAIALLSSNNFDFAQHLKDLQPFEIQGLPYRLPRYFRNSNAYRMIEVANSLFIKSADGQVLERLKSLEEIVFSLELFDVTVPHDTIYSAISLSKDVVPRRKISNFHPYVELTLGLRQVLSLPFPLDSLTAQSLRPKRQPNSNQESSLTDNTIVVSYKAPVLDAYKDYLENVVKSSLSLDVICRPWAMEVSDGSQLPSWVLCRKPRPVRGKSSVPYEIIEEEPLARSPATSGWIYPTHRQIYRASGGISACWDYRDYSTLTKSLVMKGFVVDSVNSNHGTVLDGIISSEWKERFWTSDPDSFWRTLIADQGLEGTRPPPPYYRLAADWIFARRISGSDITSEGVFEEYPLIFREFLAKVLSTGFDRSLITSHELGLPGLAPFQTEERDKICILDGCSVPVILREYNTADILPTAATVIASASAATESVRNEKDLPMHYYQFIGECYIDGMMDGQAMKFEKVHGKTEFWVR